MIYKGEMRASLLAMIKAVGYQDCGVAWRADKNPKAYWWIKIDNHTEDQRNFDTIEQAQLDLDTILAGE